MRAVVCTGYGSPDRLTIREVERPTPGPDEVLVRVHATTANRTDHGLLRGKPFFARFSTGLTRPRRRILGTEFAGRLEAVGDAVTTLEVGDRVFGMSDRTYGAHAEFLVLPERGALATIPDGMTYHEVAPSSEGAHYALSCIEAADIGAGDDVLVHGATGAIGSAAVQLLRHLGARVTAVCDGHGVDVVRTLGADIVLDAAHQDFTAIDDRFDIVLDAVGKSTFGRCRPLLKPGGMFLTTDLGPWGQNLALIPLTRVLGDHRVLLPFPRDTRGHVLFVRELLERGDFRPVIDRAWPLDEIVQAFRYVETERKLGNVVIDVVPPEASDRP